jgi:hypothetical protein
MIVELPGDIGASILSNWIDMKTLAILDSAMCASEMRAEFLAIFGNQSFVVDTMYLTKTTAKVNYVQHVVWLMKRHVRVQNWTVNSDMVELYSPTSVPNIAGPHVRSLYLHHLTAEETHKVSSTLAAVCSELQKLEMVQCQRWTTLSTLGSAARMSLQELTIRHCEDDCTESYDQFANLQKLHIRCLHGTDVAMSVTELLITAPNLIDLRLSSLYQCPINDKGLQVLSAHAAWLAILELDIQHQKFTPAALISLAESCTRLKTLALLCGDKVNGAVVEAFALNCGLLDGLKLWGRFTPASLAAVAKHCGSRLRYLSLDMNRCAKNGLVVIAGHCQNLEELQLHHCGFQLGKLLVRLVSSLPRLKELLLMNSSAITDEVLVAIAAHLPNLQHLGICCCGYEYTEAGAQALVTSLTQLQRFNIRSCDTSAFTPALRKRWQEASPGLQFVRQPSHNNAVLRAYALVLTKGRKNGVR